MDVTVVGIGATSKALSIMRNNSRETFSEFKTI